jgi:hypothetical protein
MTTALLVIALACFGLAAFGVPAKINLTAAGLACWVGSILIPLL